MKRLKICNSCQLVVALPVSVLLLCVCVCVNGLLVHIFVFCGCPLIVWSTFIFCMAWLGMVWFGSVSKGGLKRV